MLQRLRQHFYYSLLPRLVDLLTNLATITARRKLVGSGAHRVLIDNTVLAYGVTHESAWISTGQAKAGDYSFDTGYLARIPVRSENDKSESGCSVRYLPGIAHLARRNYLSLITSSELTHEQFTQPAGRYLGYGYYDYSIFSGIKIDEICDPEFEFHFGPATSVPSLEAQREKRLGSIKDPLFHELVAVIGKGNSLDAWHIVTAERNDCYCFLTMDFSLIRILEAQARNATVMSLRTKVLTPEQFGKKFSIPPISPRLFSYHDATFPVEHGTNWAESRRRKRGEYKDEHPR